MEQILWLCLACGQDKPPDKFKQGKNICKDCDNAQCRARYAKNPDKARAVRRRSVSKYRSTEKYRTWVKQTRVDGREKAWHDRGRLKHKYGITPEQYQDIVKRQGGVCAICGRPPKKRQSLHIDHDHKTGEIRGLLCLNCNVGIAQFRDDVGSLYSAIAYLQKKGRRAGSA